MMPPARCSSQLPIMPARRPTPTVLCLPPACATGLPYQPASLRSRSPVQNNTPGARPPAKRGRPKNTKPHAIPRLPRSNSNIPPARLREIKADQAIKLNNAASARWRAKQTASRQRNQALLPALQAKHSELIESEEDAPVTAYYLWLLFLLTFCFDFAKFPHCIWRNFLENNLVRNRLGTGAEPAVITQEFLDFRPKYYFYVGFYEFLNMVLVVHPLEQPVQRDVHPRRLLRPHRPRIKSSPAELFQAIVAARFVVIVGSRFAAH